MFYSQEVQIFHQNGRLRLILILLLHQSGLQSILSDGTGVRQLYIDQTGISFDAGNNRLGINSTAPEYDLDVRGDQQLFGKLYVSNGSGTAGQLLTSNGIDKNFWSTPDNLAAGSALSVTAYPTDADQIFRLIFVEENAVTSQSLYQDSGDALVFNPRTNRIGIGSTTPTAELDVQGDVSVANSITSGEYFGEGSTIVGIVTQMVPSIGINMTATQTSGKGKVTIDAYKPVGRTSSLLRMVTMIILVLQRITPRKLLRVLLQLH